MNSWSRFYLTTAIDYVNSRPHLGTAYEKIAADVIARYKRLAGFDDALRDGQRRALAERLPQGAASRAMDPLAYCDRMERRVPRRLGAARHLVRRLHPDDPAAAQGRRCRSSSAASTAAGDIYEGFYEGWYCVGCEAFKQEKDLVDGMCPIHRPKPDWIKEKNYFFRLSKYTEPLLDALRGAS